MDFRSGIGFDAHRFAENRALVLGGVTIEFERGLAGHSDADVLSHAIADAMLGAVADGDIGTHFPDTDARWKDACSLDLLGAVNARLATHGTTLVNVDATVIAEQPRLAPHIPAMRVRLATALALEEDRISVKATTVEAMGALGRKEGIAAMAVVSVQMEKA
jgi:2-C-methyl-D-erythritol 2,4-cyclodiphosphate synthase